MSEPQDIAEVLGKHTPHIQALANQLRGAIKAIQPDMTEDGSVKLSNIYFRHNRVVCALSLHKNHVNLHFYKGVELNDPDGRLQGSGKALRHLKYTQPHDINREVLRPFVQQAYQLNEQ